MSITSRGWLAVWIGLCGLFILSVWAPVIRDYLVP